MSKFDEILDGQDPRHGYLVKVDGEFGVAAYHLWTEDHVEEMVCFWTVRGWLRHNEPTDVLFPPPLEDEEPEIEWLKAMDKPFGWAVMRELRKQKEPKVIKRSTSPLEVAAIKRLLNRARDKKDIAFLLLNSYNSFKYKVNLRIIMRYAAGELDDTLESDLFTFFYFLEKGIELHEVIEREEVEALIGRLESVK